MDADLNDILHRVSQLSQNNRKRLAAELAKDDAFAREVLISSEYLWEKFERRSENAQRLREALRKRNRTSDPDTIRRNNEIIDKREENPKHWTAERLAEKYELTERYIRRICSSKEKPKWRKLRENSAE